jgi:MscS family membrane protein
MQEFFHKIDPFQGEFAWVVHIFLVIFAALLIDFIQKRILKHIEAKLVSTKVVWDDTLIYAVRAPLTVFIWLMGLSIAASIVKFQYVAPLTNAGIIAIIAWAIIRFIKQVEERIILRSEEGEHTIDRTTADAITQLLRLSVLITAALVILQTLGFNISAVLAFGGIGGLAVGFAAKDLLANFFGGLMVYLDRPFAIGEWVRSPDRDIEGVVEKIGWRLSVIRTFDKRPVYVPNAVFTSIAVENPSRMSHRRIYETVGVRYDDVGVLPGVIEDVKAMLQNHPDIATDQTLMVNFTSFAASSLDFFVYCFTKTVGWVEYNKVKQDVLFKISDIIAAHGAEIAFPTSTVHVPEPIHLQNTDS